MKRLGGVNVLVFEPTFPTIFGGSGTSSDPVRLAGVDIIGADFRMVAP